MVLWPRKKRDAQHADKQVLAKNAGVPFFLKKGLAQRTYFRKHMYKNLIGNGLSKGFLSRPTLYGRNVCKKGLISKEEAKWQGGKYTAFGATFSFARMSMVICTSVPCFRA